MKKIAIVLVSLFLLFSCARKIVNTDSGYVARISTNRGVSEVFCKSYEIRTNYVRLYSDDYKSMFLQDIIINETNSVTIKKVN